MKPAKESLELIEKMKELAKQVIETERKHIPNECDGSNTVYDNFRYVMFQEAVCDALTHLKYTSQVLSMSDKDIDETCKEAGTTPKEYLSNLVLKALLSGLLGGLNN